MDFMIIVTPDNFIGVFIGVCRKLLYLLLLYILYPDTPNK